MTIPFQPDRFRTAAGYYTRGRLSYPDALIVRVAERVHLSRQDRVLDLGCGPGFLAAAFAPFAAEVIGVDPEPAMLVEAEAYARERGVHAVFRQGSSYDIAPDWGTFQLVTMGRSFHWMDRAATLNALAEIVPSGGAVALFHDRHLRAPENAWKEHYDAALTPFLDRDPVHAVLGYRSSGWVGHEVVLLDSPFGTLERIGIVRRLETPVDSLIDRALSMSPTSPQKLGDDLPKLVEAVRAALTPHSRDGKVVELVESDALLGFRA
jgi:SAM-dependent methyltransferase